MTAKSSSKGKASKSQNQSNHSPSLKELIQVLEKDLTLQNPKSAITLIEQWEEFLKNVDEQPFKDVEKELKGLKKALNSQKSNPSQVADSLNKLSEQISDVQNLSKALVKASSSLDEEKTEARRSSSEKRSNEKTAAKSAQTEDIETPDIESLVAILEDDLIAVEPNAALEEINQWQAVLKASGDASFKAIAKGLENLEKMLQSKKVDTLEIAELLAELGDQVTDSAESAEGDIQNHLQTVGRVLMDASASLAESDEMVEDDELLDDEV
jgi:hypothetical protein